MTEVASSACYENWPCDQKSSRSQVPGRDKLPQYSAHGRKTGKHVLVCAALSLSCSSDSQALGADDAKHMLDLLNNAIRSGAQQAMCCQLASCTSSRAFELLCASCERHGIVFVGRPDAKEGAVFCDRDPSLQHELVSGPLTHQVALQWCRLTGKHYVVSRQ